MTHRVFSRNASSSRAIPVAKIIEQVRNEPAGPVHWGTNKPGMQAGEELTGTELTIATDEWNRAAKMSAMYAENMMDMGLHKQVANRGMEPYQWMNVVVTSSYWANFFALRTDGDADPTIQFLADLAYKAYNESTPEQLHHEHGIHAPFTTEVEKNEFTRTDLCKISAARCARTSYNNHDGTDPDFKKDLNLYDMLMGGNLKHSSPTEHQAWPKGSVYPEGLNGNLSPDWVQFRKTIRGENQTTFKEISE